MVQLGACATEKKDNLNDSKVWNNTGSLMKLTLLVLVSWCCQLRAEATDSHFSDLAKAKTKTGKLFCFALSQFCWRQSRGTVRADALCFLLLSRDVRARLAVDGVLLPADPCTTVSESSKWSREKTHHRRCTASCLRVHHAT